MTLYDKKYYQKQQDNSYLSAIHVVPLIKDLVHPHSVVDIGCGLGTWLSAFKEAGVKEIRGVDGSYIRKEMLHIPEENFLPWDLKKPLKLDKVYDLALCLEVAEHLQKKYSQILINSLTSAAPVVVFSAAIPFQGGTHHVNEQWPDYWVSLFKKKGYIVVDCLRRQLWNNRYVEFWYAQNMLVFVKKQLLNRYPKLKSELIHTAPGQLNLVHPVMHVQWRTSLAKFGSAMVKKLYGKK